MLSPPLFRALFLLSKGMVSADVEAQSYLLKRDTN